MNKIPLARPYLGEEEVKEVAKVIRSGNLSLGPKLPEFEKQFAKYIGRKHAIAVNSGTSGLHLCIKALGIKPGDEVITTPFSFVASSNPILFEGGKPVFVDIEEETYNIDPGKIEKAINRRTKAILIVHLFGRPCNMQRIMEIAGKKNIPVIEDACEAIGARFKGRNAGTFGKMAVFAFYPNKQMTTGEGGMIVTNDERMHRLLRSLRNQGRDDSGEWLNHVRLGYNYRLDEMSCALGLVQLKKIKFMLRERERIALAYNQRLEGLGRIILPYVSKDVRLSWWVYYLRLCRGSRDKLLDYLNSHGVSARGYFDPPIHLQPFYKKTFGFKGGEFPITEKVSSSGFILPFFVGITERQIEKVCIALEKAIRRNAR